MSREQAVGMRHSAVITEMVNSIAVENTHTMLLNQITK